VLASALINHLESGHFNQPESSQPTTTEMGKMWRVVPCVPSVSFGGRLVVLATSDLKHTSGHVQGCAVQGGPGASTPRGRPSLAT